MYWVDVRESYFNGYRQCIDPFYKDPFDNICDYSQMKKRAVYHEPFYTGETKIEPDARVLLMQSNDDYRVIKQQLQKLNRVGVRVRNNN